MHRARLILGFIAAAMFIASSATHSFLGWAGLRSALVAASAPPDLIAGLALGWHFAGAAMLAFGVMVVLLFTDRWRGCAVSLRPALVIAVLYILYGVWALILNDVDPFFLVFVIPGTMLLLAAWPTRTTAA
jgi:hypothetical protein